MHPETLEQKLDLLNRLINQLTGAGLCVACVVMSYREDRSWAHTSLSMPEGILPGKDRFVLDAQRELLEAWHRDLFPEPKAEEEDGSEEVVP
jgi:hypothetical protein